MMNGFDGRDVDEFAFGAIQLDAEGVIHVYNAAEAQITGRDPKAMIGKNFFDDVAPCTNREGFRDVFNEGVHHDDLDILFEWIFDTGVMACKVLVHLKKADTPERYWVLVKRV